MDVAHHHYLLLALFALIAVVFALAPLGIAWVLAPRKPGAEKGAIYECGLESQGDPWVPFKVQYYLYALVFVIFDIEAVILYPWAVAFTGIGLGGFVVMCLFMVILAESLVYLWLKGALDWK